MPDESRPRIPPSSDQKAVGDNLIDQLSRGMNRLRNPNAPSYNPMTKNFPTPNGPDPLERGRIDITINTDEPGPKKRHR